MGHAEYLGELEQMVLLAVQRLGDGAYGLGVMDELRERVGRRVSRGAVYVTLDRLEDKGLVESHPGPSTGERGGRPRKLLSLTPEGLEAIQAARRTWESLWEGLAWEDAP